MSETFNTRSTALSCVPVALPRQSRCAPVETLAKPVAHMRLASVPPLDAAAVVQLTEEYWNSLQAT